MHSVKREYIHSLRMAVTKIHLLPWFCFCQQMQLPSAMLTLVLVLVQSSWTMLTVMAERVTSLTAHKAHLSTVTLGMGVLE